MVQITEPADAPPIQDFWGCEFAAEFERVAPAVARLLAFCEAQGVAPEVLTQIELGVVEGVNNAIEHGCAEIENARVRLRWSWTDDVLEVRIYDPGAFRPGSTAVALPDDPLSEGGRGGFLIAAMMDSVEHRLVHGQHCIVLRKRIGEKPAFSPKDAESAALLRDMTADLSTSYESLAALFQFAKELATAPSFDVFVGRVLDRLLVLLAANETTVRLVQFNGRLKLSCARMRDVPDAEPGESGGLFTALPPEHETIEAKAFQRGAEQTVENCSAVPRRDPLWRSTGVAFVCPLFFQTKVLGVLTVLRSDASSYFTAGQVSLMRTVAEFLGIAQTTALLQEQRQKEQRAIRELEIAAEIQQSLLPKSFPNNPTSRVFGASRAALKVGGDYFDALPIGSRGVLVSIADVMGKGMPAALLATILRTSIRARLDLAENPGMLLTEVNRQINADLARLDSFITAQIAFLFYDKAELRYASAGHCPILKYASESATPARLDAGGIPLGVLDRVEYESYSEKVRSGDRFVFLTDGIYEAESPEGQAIGLEGITDEIVHLWGGTPNLFCEGLLDFVHRFTGGTEAADDRTVVALECF